MTELGPIAWPPAPIRTERLVLREPEALDRAALIELFSSPEVGTYIGGPQPRDELERAMPDPPRRRPGLFVVDLAGAMIGIVTLDPRDAERQPHVRPEAGERELGWPPTVVTCDQAQRSISPGMADTTAVHIWLTTLGAVDAHFRPARQVDYHPENPGTLVWLFIYEGNRAPLLVPGESGGFVTAPPERKLVHVTNAEDPATRDGAFIYVYGWSELGSPRMPTALPSP